MCCLKNFCLICNKLIAHTGVKAHRKTDGVTLNTAFAQSSDVVLCFFRSSLL